MQRDKAYLLDILEAAKFAVTYVGDKTKKRFRELEMGGIQRSGGCENDY